MAGHTYVVTIVIERKAAIERDCVVIVVMFPYSRYYSPDNVIVSYNVETTL